MSSLVLVDTSSWTHALRRAGDSVIRARVESALNRRCAAWCEMVRLELWSGVRNDVERDGLRLLDATLPRLPITDEVWNLAAELGSKARAAGLTVPSTDLLIFACATSHAASLEHNDQHYDLLARLE